MNDALVIARLCLAGVFLIAGVAKLTDRLGTRQALDNFGVPAVAGHVAIESLIRLALQDETQPAPARG